MNECMLVYDSASNLYAIHLCNFSYLTFCSLHQSGNYSIREFISPARPLDSSPRGAGLVCSRCYLSSARPLMLRSAGWPAWGFAHDPWVGPSRGQSSARLASSRPWHWSRKRPVLHIVPLLENERCGAGLLLPFMILNPYPCLSLPLQTIACLNLISLFLIPITFLHRIYNTALLKITHHYTLYFILNSYMNRHG